MFPKIQEQNKVQKELKKFEQKIQKIQNVHVRNTAIDLLKDLKNEYTIIDNSFNGLNGPVTPLTARESVVNSIDIRRRLTNLLKT